MSILQRSFILFLFWLVFFFIIFWVITTPKGNSIPGTGSTGFTGFTGFVNLNINTQSIIRLRHVITGNYLSAICEPWIVTVDNILSDPAIHFIIERQNGFISLQSVFTQKYLFISDNGLTSSTDILSSVTNNVPNYETWFEFRFNDQGVLIYSPLTGGFIIPDSLIQTCGNPIIVSSFESESWIIENIS